MIQADLIATLERPIPFDGPSASWAGLIIGELEIFIKAGCAGLRPRRHVSEEAGQVAPIEDLKPRPCGESGAQLQILKGVLFEIGGGEPIQPLREKEVKFDGAAAVSNDEFPLLSP